MNMESIKEGDIIELKKKHPCGAFSWKVLRTGSDLRLECTGCGHQVEIPRNKLVKGIKKIVHI